MLIGVSSTAVRGLSKFRVSLGPLRHLIVTLERSIRRGFDAEWAAFFH
jgi:hypothetical protein